MRGSRWRLTNLLCSETLTHLNVFASPLLMYFHSAINNNTQLISAMSASAQHHWSNYFLARAVDDHIMP